jgi:hypothetical protein
MTITEEITRIQAETARLLYEKRGSLTPKLWANGLNRMIVAEPGSSKAIQDASDEIRAMLLVAMSIQAEAVVCGRSDEAYVRQADQGQQYEPGDLVREADNDPTIFTCLISEGVALGGSEEVTIVSRHGLDDFGQHTWQIYESDSAEMATLIPLRAARDAIEEGLPEFWKDRTALEQFAGQMGWHLRFFPEQVE